MVPSRGKLVQFIEDNIEETLVFFAYPKEHRRHIRSTNVLERLNEELKRRTTVVRIFPNDESLLRLTRAIGSEIHEMWMDSQPYLSMELLYEKQADSIATQQAA